MNKIDYKEDDSLDHFDENGVPLSLLGGGHHFHNYEQGHHPAVSINTIPRDKILRKIRPGGYKRPPTSS